MEPPTESPGASAELPVAEASDAVDDEPSDTKTAASDGEDYFDDGAAADNDEENSQDDKVEDDEEVKAAPQAQQESDPAPDRQTLVESEGDFTSVKLSPLDFQNQRQNLKDVLMSNSATAPPLLPEKEGNNNGDDAHHVKVNQEEEHHSALHQDEFSQYNSREHYNPQNHESALGGGGLTSNENTTSSNLNPFKARKKNHLKLGAEGGRRGHSHPRKSPYRSEVSRLRHAQQLEREKRQFSKDPPEDAASCSNASGKSIGIKDTTTPPDSAFFSIQSSKLKHSLLNSLGEFLTSAFADDEESSGSYFSQDLLDQLSNSNPYLKGVWLQAKNLNDSHVQQLCDALVRNKVVTEVWLPSNQITDVGAGYIAHMLKFNHCIKELFLGENDIGPKGAAALASALARGNTTLVALGLGDNHIGVEGAGAFAAALRHNHSLHTLDIKKNGIPKKSSIRALLNKMLEFNASDPGDESLVLGLQEELANLVSSLPPDMAETVVLQAEEALKMAMLCRKRGDKIGAAEAEGMFIRICTTGEPPVDPPEEMQSVAVAEQSTRGYASRVVMKRTKRPKKPLEPDRVDDLNAELSSLKFNEDSKENDSKGSKPNESGDDQPKESGSEQPEGSENEEAKKEPESDEKGQMGQRKKTEPTEAAAAAAEASPDEEK
mmetsp:Transcript_10738/g.23810  ORF Transcript_10738/g.23810 Transcript_10738/m.23810 type:complete len:661 (+) Transcript_10738:200-2182(+)|eukprot:CAMPEP_0172319198 /NCGR_PEP_ID=MMETSP1058-20130122/37083_1 /TAXON_ID=83371 /ORGANISM="Detonula confervacea, Strain CCMP 353" /LENGTH=660 /DNA_ID=CAMNT_0013034197 /DNA_START=149 /DNA_END=2131 /DNA_ORIENTATION=+